VKVLTHVNIRDVILSKIVVTSLIGEQGSISPTFLYAAFTSPDPKSTQRQSIHQCLLRFWDLHAQKLLIKCWWNWPSNNSKWPAQWFHYIRRSPVCKALEGIPWEPQDLDPRCCSNARSRSGRVWHREESSGNKITKKSNFKSFWQTQGYMKWGKFWKQNNKESNFKLLLYNPFLANIGLHEMKKVLETK